MPTLNTVADINLFHDFGSDFAYAKEVLDTTGANTSPTDTFAELPVSEAFESVPNTSQNKKESEGGNSVTVSVKTEWAAKYTTAQLDEETYRLPEDMEGKLFLIVKEMNDEPVGGKHGYLAQVMKFVGWSGFKSKSSLEISLEPLAAGDDIDIVMAAATFPNFSGDMTGSPTLTIPNGKYYGLLYLDAA